MQFIQKESELSGGKRKETESALSPCRTFVLSLKRNDAASAQLVVINVLGLEIIVNFTM